MEWPAQLLKFVEQEVETVRRAEAILVKFVFWINCFALTVWLTGEMGYVIDYQFPLTITGLLKLIGEQHYVLGLTIYLAIHFSIQRICVLISKLSYELYGWLFLKSQSNRIAGFIATSRLFEGVLSNEVATQDANVNRRNMKRERNALHKKNQSELALTIALIYDLIVDNYYPNAHYFTGSIILWLYAAITLWEQGKSNFIVYIYSQWRDGINEFSKTTTTTTTTTKSPLS